MDIREQLLHDWLTDECGFEAFSLQSVAGDASFRRYFRLLYDGVSFVVMDAPPDRENCVAYIAITKALREMGLVSPEVIKANVAKGFLLITDLGDRQLLGELSTSNAKQLYGEALGALSILQRCRQVSGWTVPPFTAAFMVQELELFNQWFLQKHLHLMHLPLTEQMLSNTFELLATSATEQPLVFMHRDYHAANLMVLPENKIGILDFQDAFIGPVTYDLVSLLRDCYIDWPEKFVVAMVLHYKHIINLSVSDEIFLRWFDWMGLQRHMKALLTFARKYERDNNPHYLKHIPRALKYISSVSGRYQELVVFSKWFNTVVLPAYEKVSLVCEQ